MAEVVGEYLDFALEPRGIKRHRFVRELFRLARQMTPTLFSESLERALKYRIKSVETIRRIALLKMREGVEALPSVEVDESFRERARTWMGT